MKHLVLPPRARRFACRLALLGVVTSLTLGAPLLAQEATPPPTMAEIEQAWQKGDYVLVRDGLKYLAEETGTPLAQYRYGRVLVEGRGGPRDIDGAAEWLTLAAGQNHVEAMTLLARLYLSNLSQGQDEPIKLQRDPARAAELLSRAAALGDAEGQYYLAMLYNSGEGIDQDPTAAFNWLLAAAQQEHVEAQYELSRVYSEGQGVAQSNSDALDWLTRAAENNHIKAQYFLAAAYESGNGTEPDAGLAIRWYLRAAENGLPIAQRNLGTHYLQGTLVTQNVAEGLRWLEAAAAAGDSSAMHNLGVAYDNGLGVDQDDAKAADWYNRAVQHGLGRAMVAMARLHEDGRGVDRDMDQAVDLYLKALETADANLAAVRLGQLAATGTLEGRVAPHTAAPWALIAARAGDPASETWLIDQAKAGLRPAQSALAALYLGTEERASDAVEWLDLAARAGDPAAQAQLGQMLMTGTHMELDYVAAHKWFNIAATLGQREAAALRETVSALMTPEQVAEAQTAARLWFETEEPQPPATRQDVQVQE
jgi:TPR repeat protein